MGTPKRFFLLDGMALAYRAYFSFISRPLLNSKGENTSAIFGFVTTLLKILDEEKPAYVAVAFDTKEPTFRHILYQDYKATRQKMPEDMAAQMEKLKEVVRTFHTPLIEKPGYEADDIIGTLARRAEQEGVMTMIVTGDKDFMQLISPLIRMYKPGKTGDGADIVGEEGVREKFGVTPDKVIDVLGLTGDSSDNVPGVPGIGEKTAIPLIQKYGSMQKLYDHVEEIPQKGVREKLTKGKELAFLSRKLVTIDTNVPLDVDFHSLRAAERDNQRLLHLFTELEFKSLASRMRNAPVPLTPAALSPAAEAESVPDADTAPADITTDKHTYTTVTTEKALDRLCEELRNAPLMVFDTETTSTDPLQAELVGLSFCIREREAWYVPVRSSHEGTPPGGGLFGEDNAVP